MDKIQVSKKAGNIELIIKGNSTGTVLSSHETLELVEFLSGALSHQKMNSIDVLDMLVRSRLSVIYSTCRLITEPCSFTAYYKKNENVELTDAEVAELVTELETALQT